MKKGTINFMIEIDYELPDDYEESIEVFESKLAEYVEDVIPEVLAQGLYDNQSEDLYGSDYEVKIDKID